MITFTSNHLKFKVLFLFVFSNFILTALTFEALVDAPSFLRKLIDMSYDSKILFILKRMLLKLPEFCEELEKI